MSVEDVTASGSAKHPWSIGGGGASDLRERLEAKVTPCARGMRDTIGLYVAVTRRMSLRDRRHGVRTR